MHYVEDPEYDDDLIEPEDVVFAVTEKNQRKGAGMDQRQSKCYWKLKECNWSLN